MDGSLALGSDPRVRSKGAILWYYLCVNLVLLLKSRTVVRDIVRLDRART